MKNHPGHGRIFFMLISLIFLGLSGCDRDTDQKPAAVPDRQQEKSVAPKEAAAPPASLSREELITRYGNLPFRILDCSEQQYKNAPALGITLSSPLDLSTDFQPNLRVLNDKDVPVDGRWIASDNGLHLYFRNIEPRRTYKVIPTEKLTDALGRTLDADSLRTQSINTRDLDALATFAGTGMVLPADLGRGLPVDSVNVAEVDVDFHRIVADKIPEFLSSYENREYSTYQLQSYPGIYVEEGGSEDEEYRRQYINQYLNLAYTGRFQLTTEKNARIRNFLPVDNIAQLREPGLYLAIMKGAGSYPDSFQTTTFYVSDLGLHVRLYDQVIDVHCSSLTSGKAVSGVTVQLLSAKGELMGEAASDAAGIASIARPQKETAVVLAKNGKQIALVDLRQPAMDLTEFKQGERRGFNPEVFVYGPRDIYRPGETVQFAALLRDADGRAVPPVPLQAEFQQPDGNRLGQFVWQGDAQGFYRHAWTIPKSAPLGRWFLRVTGPDGFTREHKFRVEDFLPERLRLDLAAPGGQPGIIGTTEEIRLSIQGNYLYGAPASGNRLSLALSVVQDREPLPELPGFVFGNPKEEMNYEIQPEEVTLDKAGHLEWRAQSQWQKLASPALVKVEASLFDDGGRPVNRLFTQRVWPQATALGIRPASFAPEESVPVNSLPEFEVVRAGRDGKLVAGEAEARLVAEQRNHYWTRGEHGWELGFTEKEYVVYSETVSLPEGAKARVRVPVESGYYRLELVDKATGSITGCRFRAGETWWFDEKKPEVKAAPRPDQVMLQLNQVVYREGDIAKVRITPPFDAEVLLAVETDHRLWSQRLSVPATGSEVEVRIDPTWGRHDLYITALALRPAGKTEGPNRAVGLLHLPLDRSERKMTVSLEAPGQTRPNQPYIAKIKVNGIPAGKKAWVTLAAVDEGVLSLTRFKTPDAFAWFFAARRYHPDLKDLYHRIIEAGAGERGKLRFGGDEALNLAGKQPDEDVEILSRFLGPVEVNEAGEAEIRFDLPDFNGAMRLMALAYTGEAYGAAEQSVTIAAPLVAELTMPRFLAGDDASRLTLALQNLTDAAQKLTVELMVSSPLHMETAPRNVELAAKEKKVFVYPVRVETMFAKADIDLTVSGMQVPEDASPSSFTRHWTMPVRPAYPAETRRSFARLDNNGVFRSDPLLVKDLAQASLQARLTVDRTPPLGLGQHFKELLHYPYGCLEQTTSTAFTLTMAAPDRLKELGLAGEAIEEAERTKRVRAGIDRISTMQKYNGGFGFWDSSAPEEHWLTAYVGDFLLTAREAGFTVDAQLLDKTMARLAEYLRTEGHLVEERWSDEPGHYTFAYKSYAGYVLSRVNRARLGDLRTLFDNHRQNVKRALPLIHLGIALQRQGDNPRAEEAFRLALALKPAWGTGYSYYGDYGSAIRDEAILLALLQKEEKSPTDAGERLFNLAAEIDRKQYMSTQERNAIFFLGATLKAGGTEWQGELRAGGGAPETLSGSRVSRLFPAATIKSGLEFLLQGGGPAFIRYEVNGYPTVPSPPSTGNRLVITRTLRDTKGNLLNNSRFRAGDLVLVDLAISNQHGRMPDLLVVDLLAAGFELENQGLANSIKIDDLMVDKKSIAEHVKEHPVKFQEYRADRFVAAIDMESYRDSARHLFYLMRAVTPGKYRMPQPVCEDMYRPNLRAVGAVPFEWVEILAKEEGVHEAAQATAPSNPAPATIHTAVEPGNGREWNRGRKE